MNDEARIMSVLSSIPSPVATVSSLVLQFGFRLVFKGFLANIVERFIPSCRAKQRVYICDVKPSTSPFAVT